jgi:hypothetical protein
MKLDFREIYENLMYCLTTQCHNTYYIQFYNFFKLVK